MLFTDSKSKYVTMFFWLATHNVLGLFSSHLSVLIFFQLTVFYFMWYFTMLGPKIVKKNGGTYGNIIR